MTFSKLISGTIPHNYVHGGYKRRDRGGITPSRFIVHHWAGTSGGDARLSNPSEEASANYLVFSDGTIKGQVPEEYGAWTSGSAAADNPSITIEVQNSGGRAAGQDDNGRDSWPISAAAWKSLVSLLAEVANRHGFDAGNIRFHREFAPTACPGGYIWNRRAQLAADARKGSGSGSTTPKPPSGGGKKTVSQLADEVIAGTGGWGNDPGRTHKLLAAGYDANAVQAEVNRRLNGSGSAKPDPTKSVAAVAADIAAGRGGWGNDPERARKLTAAGYNAAAVQAEVNRIMSGVASSSGKKSVAQLAAEIIAGTGGWGNDPQRSQRLRAAGYDAAAVQAEVNRRLS